MPFKTLFPFLWAACSYFSPYSYCLLTFCYQFIWVLGKLGVIIFQKCCRCSSEPTVCPLTLWWLVLKWSHWFCSGAAWKVPTFLSFHSCFIKSQYFLTVVGLSCWQFSFLTNKYWSFDEQSLSWKHHFSLSPIVIRCYALIPIGKAFMS